MSENFEVNLLLERKPPAAARRQLIQSISRIATPWFGQPHTVMLQTVSTGAAYEQPWTMWINSDIPRLEDNFLLHVYEPRRGDEPVSTITVEESFSAAVYSLAIPLRRLEGVALNRLEDLSEQLHHPARKLSPAVAIAGVEYTASVPIGSLEAALTSELRDSSLMTTIVLPREVGLPADAPFTLVHESGGVSVYRHVHAAARIGN